MASVTGKKLTVGMATYDDYDGVYFTVQGIRLGHPEVAGEIELLVVDNHAEGHCREALEHLARDIDEVRYLSYRDVHSTAVRDLVFHEARTPYVLCVDSHVLLAPGALRRLIDYLDARPGCRDLLQGPLLNDGLTRQLPHLDPVWSKGMWGVWGQDERATDPDAEPFEIPMQGLGVFACRRDAWLGFNPRFQAFGGEEGYIHEKFRRAGRRTLCLPFLRWLHRFQRPLGTKYQHSWDDRIRNYLIGHQEVGLPSEPIVEHFREHIGVEGTDRIVRQVRREMAGPFFFFDAIYCVNLDGATERWQDMERRFAALGIGHRVRRLPAVRTPGNHHVGCALSHRAVLERAERQGLENVLVFEDDALFRHDAVERLADSVTELRGRDWKVFYLGGCTYGAKPLPETPGCSHLRTAPRGDVTCTHAVAYNRPVFRQLLEELPEDEEGMRQWVETDLAIDQHLRRIDQRFVAHPMVSLQEFLFDLDGRDDREEFRLGDAAPEAQEQLDGDKVLALSPQFDAVPRNGGARLYELRQVREVALNATAAAVVGLVDGRRSVGEIRELLQDAYPEAAAQIARDVDETLSRLVGDGALQEAEPEDPPEVEGVLGLDPEYEVAAMEKQTLVYSAGRNQLFTLNPTAASILGLLDGERSTTELRELLQQAYPEAAAAIASDVSTTLAHLLSNGAVRRLRPSVEGVFSLAPGWQATSLEDRILVYHSAEQKTLALRGTAVWIFSLMDGRRSTAEVRELLREAYPEAAEDVGRDVENTLARLSVFGALELRPASPFPLADQDPPGGLSDVL